MRLRTFLIWVSSLFIAGCSLLDPSKEPGVRESIIQPAECALLTGDDIRFHIAAVYGFEQALKFPGMLVGIDKTHANAVHDKAEGSLKLDPDRPAWIDKELVKPKNKLTFISLVAHTVPGNDIYAKPAPVDTIFNAYSQDAPKKVKSSGGKSASECGYATYEDFDHETGWRAIAGIRDTLKADLDAGHYTHVFVIVMGWNTQQAESIQNFNSIVGSLVAKAPDKNFRPYVIGVTWPSEWDNAWIAQRAIQPTSLVTKGQDATEIGAGWLGAVFDHAVLPTMYRREEKLIVIGHSYGARATSYAVCKGSALRAPFKDGPRATVDTLIGLEGAYSIGAYDKEGSLETNIKYEVDCPRADRLIFTSSIHDTAADAAGIIDRFEFAGAHATYEDVRNNPRFGGRDHGFVVSAWQATDSHGSIKLADGPNSHPDGYFCFVDASQVIFYNAPNSGAGAHSDIYRPETANMLWNLMDAKNCKARPRT